MKERISGNLDAPEGGFDAILQTAVCKVNRENIEDGIDIVENYLNCIPKWESSRKI